MANTSKSRIDPNAPLTEQAKLVLDYLNAGRTLTPMIAMVSLGVGSLTARIAELRRKGHTIGDEWSKDHFNRRYKTYWLGDERPTDEERPADETPST